jgi:soluble lytic murein transglycosylase-like protein
VAEAESGFNPRAVSRAGALGLMQLMPCTARGLGVDPMVPAQAVDGAARMLAGLLHRFGSTELAVAAYNAGENAVDKWRTRYPGLAPDEFVESISFRETRTYVKLVLRDYRTYRRLYEKGAGAGGWGPGLL